MSPSKIKMRILYRASATLWVLSVPMFGQKPALKIVSPKDGAIVHPGDKVVVTVEPTGAKFSAIIIVPSAPIELGDMRTASPYRFLLAIPERGMEPGPYHITADGVTEARQHVSSEAVTVDVEPRNPPVSIRAGFPQYVLDVGGEIVVDVMGNYQDGSFLVLNRASNTKFVIEGPPIISVDHWGVMKALSVGETHLAIHVGSLVARVPVTVKQPEVTNRKR
jgi:hypothetical protein